MMATSLEQTSLEDLSQQQWHTLTPQEISQRLASDPVEGLTEAEAEKRQRQFGRNQLTAKPGKPPWLRFLSQFQQPLIYILLVAAAVMTLLQDWVDAGVIFAVTLINAVIGYVQEAKAEGAIAALAAVVTTEATVVRRGEKHRLNSADLVPGDVVLLTAGDKVPADLRLFQLRDLQVDESALTGESLPVAKTLDPVPPETPLAERTNMVYAGSLVTAGQGRGMVVAIANTTETGRISRLIQASTTLETPLTRKIHQFSQTLLYVILGLAALTFAVGLGQGESWVDVFQAAVALAVSAIPEGLPAVVTITLAIGVSRMAARHAIIRKLPAVETLGGTTVICSDKTGTLTENQMTVQAIYAGGHSYGVSGSGYAPEGEILWHHQPLKDLQDHPVLRQCLQVGLLCNDSHLQYQEGRWTLVGDPTEAALITVAAKLGLTQAELELAWPRLDAIPFESEHQYMATLHQHSDDRVIYLKGAVEAVLKRSSQERYPQGDRPIDPAQIEQAAAAMAARGLRVLAFALKPAPKLERLGFEEVEQDLVFVGLQGMIDPPRPEAVAAVRACQSAGIQVKMITGDHALTASAIAQQMGLDRTPEPLVFTGAQLAQMDNSQLAQAAGQSMVFARVAPEQKLRLVEALQRQGEIVAMTGDGVNDAPALKQADIGIAMGITGTEVAKEAADMILTDDNFASIEAAVEEGRTVYQNLRKAIAFILPVNGGESMTILIAILLATALPILPLQILWLNMVSSVALTVPLAFEPKDRRVMQRPPRNPNQPLLSGSLLRRILVISAFNWLVIFGIFEWGLQTTANLALARTLAVNALVAAETFYLLSISHLVPSLLARLRGRPEPMGYPPAIGIGAVILLQIFFSQSIWMNQLFETVPLTLAQGLICVGVGLPVAGVALLLQRFDPMD